jgi:hypothetical protein
MPSVLKSGILGSHSEEVSFLLFRFLWTSKEIEDSRKPLKNNNDYLSKMKERRCGILRDLDTLMGIGDVSWFGP